MAASTLPTVLFCYLFIVYHVYNLRMTVHLGNLTSTILHSSMDLPETLRDDIINLFYFIPFKFALSIQLFMIISGLLSSLRETFYYSKSK